MGDDAYIGDCNVAGMIGVKGANAATPGFALYNNSGTLLGKLYTSGSTLIWSGGIIQATTFNGNAATASKLGTSTIGATNVPIYLNGGTPTAVNLNSTANNLINNLTEGTSTPTDADYYVSQYVNGGTTTTSYHRRPHSALYAYIKGKAEGTWNINITGSSSSATKLQTSRLLWGQPFDGTADVNGTIYINNSDSSNGAIRLNNNINSNARISAINDQVIFNTGNAIRFGGTDWDWNQWAGLKYTHSNKTIYLGIADGSIFTANLA